MRNIDFRLVCPKCGGTYFGSKEVEGEYQGGVSLSGEGVSIMRKEEHWARCPVCGEWHFASSLKEAEAKARNCGHQVAKAAEPDAADLAVLERDFVERQYRLAAEEDANSQGG